MADHVLPEEKPHLLSFEITKRCNYRCVFCYQGGRIETAAAGTSAQATQGKENARQQPEMTLEEIREHLIPQVEDMKVRSFCFIGAEPMLRYEDLLALATDFNRLRKTLKEVQVSTNGYLLDGEKIEALRKAYRNFLLTFAVPVDSLDPDISRRLRPPKADALERARTAIATIVKKGLYGSSEMVATRLNVDEMEAIGKDLKHLAKGHFFQEVYPCFGTGSATGRDELFLTPEQLQAVDRYKIEHYGDPVLMWDSMPFPVTDKAWDKVKKHAFPTAISHGCSAANNYFNVDHAGNVYPCNFLDIHLGTIKAGPHALRDIWETHPLVQKLRNRDVGGKCGRCKYKINCGGCRSRALMETGDVLGGVESCQGGEDGHPLEAVMERNLLKAYRRFHPIVVTYHFLKKLRIVW